MASNKCTILSSNSFLALADSSSTQRNSSISCCSMLPLIGWSASPPEILLERFPQNVCADLLSGYMERISKVQQHLEPVAVKTVLGRVSTASEPGLLDAHRRLLECSSIHECEAWLKYFTSVRPESEEGEFDIDLGNVVGTLPTFLLESGGTFVRSGPGLFERDGTRIHMADADGLMATLTFTPRGIKYKKRYIRTPQFALENDLDRILFRGSYGTSQVHGDGLTQRIANNVGNLKWKITGNTNHMFWNRRLFALHEVGLPIELDPITLAVVNPQSTLDSALSSKRQGDSFSAHYRIDPNTNTLLNFGINFVKGDVTFWEFDSEFRLLAQLQVKIFPTVVHSFAITPKYFVHYFPPTKAGLSHVRGVLTYVLGWGVDDSFLHDTSQEFAYICIVERGHLCQTRKQAKPFVTWHRVANFWPNHHVGRI
ncbi:hypothetical protein BASA82_001116 [Batrachochytrium salamandrivorans]|nr:hypothetical protein BASA82_001116 [Batrachochytrium salamandrivorans]